MYLVKPSHQMLQPKLVSGYRDATIIGIVARQRKSLRALQRAEPIEKIQIIAGVVIRSHSLSMRSTTEEEIKD